MSSAENFTIPLQIVAKEKNMADEPTTDVEPAFADYIRKPFMVEAVEVTVENIEDLAKYIGTLRKKDDGTPFIAVDRRLIPNVYRVYPGFWMTRMGDNIRCYSKKIFNEQFTVCTEEGRRWIEQLEAKEGE